MDDLYSDHDDEKCEWLRELVKCGVVPTGKVDARPIQELQSPDVAGFRRVHFFAGIGGWAEALRLAGWPDDRPVWTGSCPCPPFSAAGKKKACPECGGSHPVPCPRRSGYFICCNCDHAWHADERHLWPEFWRLINECRPPVVFGEQVAGSDGLVWFAGVRASLEAIGYCVGGADLCAASVGSPNIRQRLFWVAYAGLVASRGYSGSGMHHGAIGENETERRGEETAHTTGRRSARRLADSEHDGGRLDESERGPEGRVADRRSGAGTSGLADTNGRESGDRGVQRGGKQRLEPEDGGTGGGLGNSPGEGFEGREPELLEGGQAQGRLPAGPGDAGGLGDASEGGRGILRNSAVEGVGGHAIGAGGSGGDRLGDADGDRRPGQFRWSRSGEQSLFAGPSREHGFWDEFDLLPCRDGQARRVEPGSFPLVDGFPGRVGLLRGYGDAICPQAAAEFIKAFLDAESELCARSCEIV